MKQWADQQLPRRSVECAWETLKEEFNRLVEKAKLSKDHDDIFDQLKAAVVDESMRKHQWEDKVHSVSLSYRPGDVIIVSIKVYIWQSIGC